MRQNSDSDPDSIWSYSAAGRRRGMDSRQTTHLRPSGRADRREMERDSYSSDHREVGAGHKRATLRERPNKKFRIQLARLFFPVRRESCRELRRMWLATTQFRCAAKTYTRWGRSYAELRRR